MNQAIKDRLFALGIEIPEEISAGDNPSIQRWAEQAIADVEGDDGETLEFAGDAFYEVVTAGDVDLLALLRLVNEAALELAELAIEQGDQAVYDRIGVPPEWPGLLAWVESVVTPAAAADVQEEVAADPDLKIKSTGASYSPGTGETEPDADAEHPISGGAKSPEELAEMAAELERREEIDAAAREGAEVTTSIDGEDETEKLPIELLNARIGELELRVEAQESQGKEQWAGIGANTDERMGGRHEAVQERLTDLEGVVDKLWGAFKKAAEENGD